MFCLKCGKQIRDDSEFCSFCGLKIEIKEKQDTVGLKKIKNRYRIMFDKYGYGWIILFLLFELVYRMSNINSILTKMSIVTVLIIFYISFRSFLIKNNFGKGNIKLSSCLSFFVSFLLIFISVFVINGFMKFYQNSSNDWVKYNFNDDGDVHFYKKGNIDKEGGNYIVQVWDKKVLSDKNREKLIQEMTEHGDSTEGYNKLSYGLSLREIDCKKRKTRTLSGTLYDSDGKILYVTNYDFGWNYISPDSDTEKLLRKVCE